MELNPPNEVSKATSETARAGIKSKSSTYPDYESIEKLFIATRLRVLEEYKPREDDEPKKERNDGCGEEPT